MYSENNEAVSMLGKGMGWAERTRNFISRTSIRYARRDARLNRAASRGALAVCVCEAAA